MGAVAALGDGFGTAGWQGLEFYFIDVLDGRRDSTS
jgi:hypothetical protein